MILYNILLFIPICIFTLKLNYILNLYLNKNVLYLNHTTTKRRYITKNIVKSIILLIITIITLKAKYYIYRYNYWNNFLIHTIGSFYVSNDVLGLILIKDLSRSTKFHHIISTILLFINYFLANLTFEYFFVDKTPDGPSFSIIALQLTVVSICK